MEWHLQLVDLFPRTRSVDMFPEAKERTGSSQWTCFPEPTRSMTINLISSCHVETVCCLYHQKKDFISVPYEPKNTDYLKKDESDEQIEFCGEE